MNLGFVPSAEALLNTTSLGNQSMSNVIALPDGGYIALWTGGNAMGTNAEVFSQRFDALGNKVGGEILINSTTTDYQSNPAATVLSGGGYVVTWMSQRQDSSGYGIYSQAYDLEGNPVGGEARLNTTTIQDQQYPAITSLSDGGYVVIWQSNVQDGSGFGLYSQRFDAYNVALGSETRINTWTNSNQVEPTVTRLNDGGYVVAWQSSGQDSNGYGIFAQLFDSQGNAVGLEKRANTVTAWDQSYPSVTGLTDGGYVIVWQSYKQNGSGIGIYAQRYNAAGDAVGLEMLISSNPLSSAQKPDVAALNDGGFVVCWSDNAIFAKRYDSQGILIGGETQINSSGWGLNPKVTSLSDGSFIIAWTGLSSEGYESYSRTFKPNNAPELTGANLTTIEGDEDITYVLNKSIFIQGYTDIDGTALDVINLSTDHGVIVDNGDGTLSIVPEKDYFGVVVISFTITDGYGGDIESKVNLQLRPVNDAAIGEPSFDLHSGSEDTSYILNLSDLLIGFSDVENDSLSVLNLIADHGAVIDNGDGTVTIAPDANYNGVVTLSYSVSDGKGGDVSTVQSFTLIDTNDAPFEGNSLTLLPTGSEDTAYIVSTSDLRSGLVDIDGDTLTVENLFVDHGTVVYNGDGTFTITPKANYFGVVTIRYDISDGRGGRVSTSREITFTDIVDYITGTSDSQILSGTDGADFIDGGAGNDDMLGYGGDDTYVVDSRKDVVAEYVNQGTDTVESNAIYYLSANIENLVLTGTAAIYGTGNDLANVMTGNSGNNMLFGMLGNDTLSGGSGLDVLVGGDGDDTLDGGADTDRLKGGNGNDSLFGGDAGDSLKGEAGNDYLDGGAGADTFYGGAGDDTYIVDDALDFLLEVNGEGYDRVEASVSYTLRNYFEDLSLTGVANINGIGNTENNVITGNDGNNQLFGMFGNDTIYGGLGNDTVVGGDSNDTLNGEDGNDQLKGGYGNDSLFGGAGNDNLKGEENHDYIDGGLGVDSMYGGAGNDTYVASELGDFYVENLNEGTDTILASITFTLGNNLENLTLTGTGNINGTGNAGFNVLLGNAGNNTLSGMDGTDRITGGAGNDTLLGGNGNDTYYFDLGFGQDEINDAVGTNRITFGAGISATDVITEVVGADLYVALKDVDPLVTASNATNRIRIIGGATVAPTITYTPPAIVAESSALSAAITTFSAPSTSAALTNAQDDTTKAKAALALPTNSLWQSVA